MNRAIFFIAEKANYWATSFVAVLVDYCFESGRLVVERGKMTLPPPLTKGVWMILVS